MQLLQEFDAVHLRHHEVEHDDVDPPGIALQHVKADAAVFRDMGHVTISFDCVLQQTTLNRIILDDQNLGACLGITRWGHRCLTLRTLSVDPGRKA